MKVRVGKCLRVGLYGALEYRDNKRNENSEMHQGTATV